jgi:spore maturation protein CgeB
MKIVVVGKFYPEAFALHIMETLTSSGYEVAAFEVGNRPGYGERSWTRVLSKVRSGVIASAENFPSLRRLRIRKLFQLVEDFAPDVVLVCHDFLWPAEVSEIKRLSTARIVMWFPDSIASFGKAWFMTAPYDALFFKDPYIVRMLASALRCPVHYLPECFNPMRHRLQSDLEDGSSYACDVATAGNPHSWRTAVFQHLTDFNVKIWGSAPPLWMSPDSAKRLYQGQSVINEEKAKAFLSAKIVINNLHYSEVWGLNVRAFEVAGVGAFQLLDWRPGLSQLFVDGKEVVSFRRADQLPQLVSYWLRRDDERKSIGAAAKRRALAEHTYTHRLNLLLSTLNGKEHGFPLPPIDLW